MTFNWLADSKASAVSISATTAQLTPAMLILRWTPMTDAPLLGPA